MERLIVTPEQEPKICAAPHCGTLSAGQRYCPAHETENERAALFRRALESTPDSFDLRFNLGTAYRHLGRYEDALGQYQEAVRLVPENIDARYGLGLTYMHTGDLLAATEECLALQELAPEQAAALADALREYAHPDITFEGGPGDMIATAVFIRGAPTHSVRVNAEYHYLTQQYGTRDVDWQLERQELIQTTDRTYDKMEVMLSDGSQKVVFFDITESFEEFVGKFKVDTEADLQTLEDAQNGFGEGETAKAPPAARNKRWWQFWK